MTAVVIAAVVVVALMALRLADLYNGGYYACPVCGARGKDGHSSNCPWRRARQQS
jgi:hypothetical protein